MVKDDRQDDRTNQIQPQARIHDTAATEVEFNSRKWIEEERQKLIALVENSSDVIGMAAPDGRLTYLNCTGREILGLLQDDKPSQFKVQDFLSQNGKEVFDRIVLPQLLRELRWDGPVQAVNRLNHERIPMEVKAFVVNSPHGKPLCLAAILRDVRDIRRLESDIIDASEREQRRIGRDLHDELGQTLAGMAWLANALTQQLAKAGQPLAKEAGEIERLASRAVAVTRSLSKGLSPVQMSPEGLTDALRDFAASVEKIHQVSCEFESAAPVAVADNAAATNLYYIAREAVTNAVKHGKPRQIRINLTQSAHGFFLQVENDGEPLVDTPKAERGIGLDIMQYRARRIGATLGVFPRSGGGAIVRCECQNM